VSRPAWEAILGNLPPEATNALWREYSDALTARLLEDWIGPRRFGRVLKTDAYDETLGRGAVQPLAGRADALILMDWSVLALRRASAGRSGVRAVACDVRALPFAAESFDLIFSASTLDHLPGPADIEDALRALGRALRAGGRLILTLDNPSNPVVRLRNALPPTWLRRLRLTPYPVGATLGAAQIARLLERAGLKPVRWDFLCHCPRLPAVNLCRLAGNNRFAGRLVRALLAFEQLRHWPTRRLTGYYTAVEALKP